MPDSVAQNIYGAAQALLQAVRIPDANIAECLNSTLSQFLTWPFKAASACIIDAEGHSITFNTVIYTNSKSKSEDQPIKVKADAVACAVYVVESLGQEELQAGYDNIAVFKGLKRTKITDIEFPIITTPLGIVFAIDSPFPIETIGEFVMRENRSRPSTAWPDMIIVLQKGTINYATQIHGEPIKGDFFLPNIRPSVPPPLYAHVFARGLGLFSMNRMCALLFTHLNFFFPGIKLPIMDDALEGVPSSGITLSAYQFNLKGQLVPVPEECYSGRGFGPPLFRIEDEKGTLLSHLQFIPWQDGGVVHLIGKLPPDGILIFLGPVARSAQIIKQSDGAISSVLPIGKDKFIEFLNRIQLQSNMKVKPEKPKGIISKFADEGTTSPFMARLFYGILRLRDIVFHDYQKKEEFDRAYNSVFMTLFNSRTSAKKIIETLTEHSHKVAQKEIVHSNGHLIRVSESIDNALQSLIAELLNNSVRAVKDGMQMLLALLNLNIGFLYKKQGAFDTGIAGLSKTKPELSAYLYETRKWSEPLILIRNDLHAGWVLPRMGYIERSGAIETVEPQILGQSVSDFVNYMIDRVCCFIEEITVYALQGDMPLGLSLTEIPIVERKKICPERFQVTFVNGGLQIWKIAYHESKFEQT